MNGLEISFEPSPWELALENLRPGGAFSASRLLALMEGEDEESLEAAFARLEELGTALDISDLPRGEESGPAAARLRQEAQMAAKHQIGAELPEDDPLGIYLRELKALPRAEAPAQALADAFLAGDAQAGEALASGLLPQVVALAGEYTGRGVLLLDLIQEGSLGLWQGIACYSGGDIAGHCAWWVRQAMARAVLLQARATGVGAKLRRALEDYRMADQRLLTRLGRNPLVEEIAQEIGISLEDGYAVSKMFADAQTLARAHKTPEPTPDDDRAVEDTALFQTRQRIDALLSDLEETDKKLLTLRFGLDGSLPQSPEAVGRALGLTPGEVVSREAAALKKLRNS